MKMHSGSIKIPDKLFFSRSLSRGSLILKKNGQVIVG